MGEGLLLGSWHYSPEENHYRLMVVENKTINPVYYNEIMSWEKTGPN